MTSERSALRNRIEWMGLHAALAPLRVMPTRWLAPSMTALSRLGCALAVGRRRQAVQLVRDRLGLPEREARRVVRASFETMLLNLVDSTILERRLQAGTPLAELVQVEGGEHLRAALASGRGVLLCTAHFGAWEALGLVMHGLFEPAWAVVRDLDNPLLEPVATGHRMRYTRGGISKDGGGLKLARALRAGQSVIALIDQNAGSSGVILDFLGAPSSHHMVAGHFAVRQGALALPVYLSRLPGKPAYRLVIEAPVEPTPGLDEAAAAVDVTRRISASLAARVRADPGQWLWLHDRWRHAQRELRRQARAAAGEPVADGRTAVATAQGTNGT